MELRCMAPAPRTASAASQSSVDEALRTINVSANAAEDETGTDPVDD